jgi:hypothetical protein
MWTAKMLATANVGEEISPPPFSLADAVIHNNSVVVGRDPIDIATPSEQWAFAVTFPLRKDAAAFAGPVLVRVEAVVESGRIGMGCVTPDLRSFVSAEVERTFEDRDMVFEMIIEAGGNAGWLVVRNTAEGGAPSRAILRSIRTFKIDELRSPDLVDVEPRAFKNVTVYLPPDVEDMRADGEVTHRNPPLTNPVESRKNGVRRFQVLLTHTSRSWDWARCTREYLLNRYSDPDRLHNLPRLEELTSQRNHQLYSGGVSLLELAIDGNRIRLLSRRCIDSRYKIQHACFVGTKLVLCFEDFLSVIPNLDEPAAEIDVRPGSPWRIDDNWFSGLHTVFPVDDHNCVVSSSGADAVLWVDLRSRTVIRRWRLPADIYGLNYQLTPDMSVVDHYIHNDIQLGHLNCAYPDGAGGCYISTLIQGDIGHVDSNGNYSLLDRGHVGCHGVRLSQNRREIYFTDSCNGRLMRIEPGGGAMEVHRVDSRWLHDVEQVEGHLYWFCLGDKNEVVLFDVDRSREMGRFAFESRQANVQFVSVVRSN